MVHVYCAISVCQGGSCGRICLKSSSIVSNRIPRSNPMVECHVIWLNSCECSRNAHSKVFAILFSTVILSLSLSSSSSSFFRHKLQHMRCRQAACSQRVLNPLCIPLSSATQYPLPFPTKKKKPPFLTRHCQIANGHKCAPAALPNSKEKEENLFVSVYVGSLVRQAGRRGEKGGCCVGGAKETVMRVFSRT